MSNPKSKNISIEIPVSEKLTSHIWIRYVWAIAGYIMFTTPFLRPQDLTYSFACIMFLCLTLTTMVLSYNLWLHKGYYTLEITEDCFVFTKNKLRLGYFDSSNSWHLQNIEAISSYTKKYLFNKWYIVILELHFPWDNPKSNQIVRIKTKGDYNSNIEQFVEVLRSTLIDSRNKHKSKNKTE